MLISELPIWDEEFGDLLQFFRSCAFFKRAGHRNKMFEEFNTHLLLNGVIVPDKTQF